MTFNDIFKSSFLESVTGFSLSEVLLAMLFAVIVGLFIFWVYKKTFTGILYSSGFALTLIGLTLVTTLVIIAVTSNVVLSLGMVGALSIVRFRTAVKDPMDLAFLFWTISVLVHSSGHRYWGRNDSACSFGIGDYRYHSSHFCQPEKCGERIHSCSELRE